MATSSVEMLASIGPDSRRGAAARPGAAAAAEHSNGVSHHGASKHRAAVGRPLETATAGSAAMAAATPAPVPAATVASVDVDAAVASDAEEAALQAEPRLTAAVGRGDCRGRRGCAGGSCEGEGASRGLREEKGQKATASPVTSKAARPDALMQAAGAAAAAGVCRGKLDGSSDAPSAAAAATATAGVGGVAGQPPTAPAAATAGRPTQQQPYPLHPIPQAEAVLLAAAPAAEPGSSGRTREGAGCSDTAALRVDHPFTIGLSVSGYAMSKHLGSGAMGLVTLGKADVEGRGCVEVVEKLYKSHVDMTDQGLVDLAKHMPPVWMLINAKFPGVMPKLVGVVYTPSVASCPQSRQEQQRTKQVAQQQEKEQQGEQPRQQQQEKEEQGEQPRQQQQEKKEQGEHPRQQQKEKEEQGEQRRQQQQEKEEQGEQRREQPQDKEQQGEQPRQQQQEKEEQGEQPRQQQQEKEEQGEQRREQQQEKEEQGEQRREQPQDKEQQGEQPRQQQQEKDEQAKRPRHQKDREKELETQQEHGEQQAYKPATLAVYMEPSGPNAVSFKKVMQADKQSLHECDFLMYQPLFFMVSSKRGRSGRSWASMRALMKSLLDCVALALDSLGIVQPDFKDENILLVDPAKDVVRIQWCCGCTGC